MSFTIPPMDAIRSAGQALPRSAAQVASAGAAYMDSFGAAGAVRGPDSVELEGDGAPGKGGGSGEDLMKEGGDPVRASGQFALSKLVHEANLAVMDWVWRMGEEPGDPREGRGGAARGGVVDVVV